MIIKLSDDLLTFTTWLYDPAFLNLNGNCFNYLGIKNLSIVKVFNIFDCEKIVKVEPQINEAQLFSSIFGIKDSSKLSD